jgi:hypothetical protein
VLNKDWLDIDVLEDYLDGKLDAKTMNRVEREALEDPFVAEALAGLSAAPKRSLQSISLLQKQLQERVAEQRNVKKTSVITWQRLSIAATAAVLFVAVSIVFWMKENNRQNELARLPKKVDVTIAQNNKSDVAPVEPPAANSSTAKTKVIAPVDEKIDQAIATAKTNAYASVRSKAVAKSESVAADEIVAGEAPVTLKETTVVAYGTPMRKQSITAEASTISSANVAHALTGRVYSEDDGKPLPGVAIRLAGSNKPVLTDKNGDFRINADSSFKEGKVVADYIGFQRTEMIAKVNEPVSITLQPDRMQLNEVVVSSASGKIKKERNNDSVASSLEWRAAGTQVQIGGLSGVPAKTVSNPVDGWNKMFAYVEQQNRFKENKKVGQSVQLSFRIDKNGLPTDVKVIRGAESKYEEEAIRLLTKGPKWVVPKKASSRMIISIDF